MADADDDFRRHLEGEEQLDYIFEEQAARHLREMTIALDQKETERRLKEAAEEREQEERKQKEEERKQKEVLVIKLGRQMKKYGATLNEIVGETGLPAEDVEKLM